MNLKKYWSFIIYGTEHPEELAEIEDMRFKYNCRILWISGLFFIAMLAGAIVTLFAKGGDLSLASLVDLSQMLTQLACHEQVSVQNRSMLLQIALPHPAILANGQLFSFRDGKVRNEHIASLCKRASVQFIKGFLNFHGIYLQIIIWKHRKREFQYFVSLTE